MSTIRSDLADHATPLIRNAWYVAGLSDELDGGLMDRWILGQNILLYRTEAGAPVAMDNRCPHRSFPLSKGKRVGDQVACGYHGMTFAPDGRCTLFPPIAKTPGNLRTRVYPVVERAPLVWVWMGEPDAADPALIPKHHSFTEPGWAVVSGYYHIDANYVGLQENLLDLSHFEHLHSSSIGVPDQSSAAIEIETRDDGIFSHMLYRDVPAPPLWNRALRLREPLITRTIEEGYRSPASADGATTIRAVGGDDVEPRDYHIRILHFITPEHQDTTHYWWFFARDFATDDDELGEMFRSGIGAAFLEDKEALEHISSLVQADRRDDFREMSFASDKASVMLRRHLNKLAQAEALEKA
ncbi:hypothetical protein L288_02305 [Sphingobium quisquiliarum P25]|uniref:Rieske domain-containing protein n=1 Tax=Sphingobium quisquiliarum P25 TaxID=1329909 RepID=T0IPU4_9SPHN|nr:aromatic ring-hydroxylating dioxygenase subunit alpha [Sphingobium quisquiliarum]EQB13810.1 hypothetical protein L288_02305 [Sphingobium quisquiliarum P25]EZP71560.1 (2Fe-2S)-binding protein [Sphingomonas paucimobilis]